jgi:hypothetical protein
MIYFNPIEHDLLMATGRLTEATAGLAPGRSIAALQHADHV